MTVDAPRVAAPRAQDEHLEDQDTKDPIVDQHCTDIESHCREHNTQELYNELCHAKRMASHSTQLVNTHFADWNDANQQKLNCRAAIHCHMSVLQKLWWDLTSLEDNERVRQGLTHEAMAVQSYWQWVVARCEADLTRMQGHQNGEELAPQRPAAPAPAAAKRADAPKAAAPAPAAEKKADAPADAPQPKKKKVRTLMHPSMFL